MVVAAVALLVAAGLAQSAGGAGEARKGGTLRLATFVGFVTAALGLLAFVGVFWLWLIGRGPAYGFGWIMSALLIFSGIQLVMLGLIGEYLGRMFLTVNQRPQAVVREVITNRGAGSGMRVPG